jgi:hypothetical protein
VDFYGISMDFYGISMDFYGFLQISMDLNRIFHEFRLFGDPILVDFKEKNITLAGKSLFHLPSQHFPQLE